MENKTISELYNEYLSSTFVLFEIVKAIGRRELSFKIIKNDESFMVRYFLAFNIDFLNNHIKHIDLKKKPRNFYNSCASLKFIPIFSYNFKKRTKEQKYIDFNKDYEQYVTGFDQFFDFDGKENFKEAYKEASEFKQILDEFKLPYYLINSSGLGWHFIIKSDFLPKEKSIKELLKKIQNIYYNIRGIYKFQYLDKSVLMDIKQLRKCPYSPTIDGYICLPLSDQQFMDCEKSMDFLKIDNVLKNIQIKNRGLLIRKWGLSEDELKKNVDVFFKEFL